MAVDEADKNLTGTEDMTINYKAQEHFKGIIENAKKVVELAQYDFDSRCREFTKSEYTKLIGNINNSLEAIKKELLVTWQ